MPPNPVPSLRVLLPRRWFCVLKGSKLLDQDWLLLCLLLTQDLESNVVPDSWRISTWCLFFVWPEKLFHQIIVIQDPSLVPGVGGSWGGGGRKAGLLHWGCRTLPQGCRQLLRVV